MKNEKIDEIEESIKHWENILENFLEQKARGCNYSTDYLPLQLGWSTQRSIDWIQEELRLLREIKNKEKGI